MYSPTSTSGRAYPPSSRLPSPPYEYASAAAASAAPSRNASSSATAAAARRRRRRRRRAVPFPLALRPRARALPLLHCSRGGLARLSQSPRRASPNVKQRMKPRQQRRPLQRNVRAREKETREPDPQHDPRSDRLPLDDGEHAAPALERAPLIAGVLVRRALQRRPGRRHRVKRRLALDEFVRHRRPRASQPRGRLGRERERGRLVARARRLLLSRRGVVLAEERRARVRVVRHVAVPRAPLLPLLLLLLLLWRSVRGLERGVPEDATYPVVRRDALLERVEDRRAIRRPVLLLRDPLELSELPSELRHPDAREMRGVALHLSSARGEGRRRRRAAAARDAVHRGEDPALELLHPRDLRGRVGGEGTPGRHPGRAPGRLKVCCRQLCFAHATQANAAHSASRRV